MWISFVTLIFIILIVWFWYSQMKAKETATQLAKKECHETGVILLDETVHLNRIRMGRQNNGMLNFRREYHFSYSKDGQSRYRGRIILLGTNVILIRLDSLKNNPSEEHSPAQIIPFRKKTAKND